MQEVKLGSTSSRRDEARHGGSFLSFSEQRSRTTGTKLWSHTLQIPIPIGSKNKESVVRSSDRSQAVRVDVGGKVSTGRARKENSNYVIRIRSTTTNSRGNGNGIHCASAQQLRRFALFCLHHMPNRVAHEEQTEPSRNVIV